MVGRLGIMDLDGLLSLALAPRPEDDDRVCEPAVGNEIALCFDDDAVD